MYTESSFINVIINSFVIEKVREHLTFGVYKEKLATKVKWLQYNVHVFTDGKKMHNKTHGVCLQLEHWFKAGMHNIRPAGQIWPAKAFNLGREAFFLLFLKIIQFIFKTCNIWPLNIKKNYWHAMRLELCTPGLKATTTGLHCFVRAQTMCFLS